ncbi:hypothetical protein NEAUS04_0679 [Nematocida ausubeli]|nr:hypothetical protein NEAUS04_0679 [Nematocida ausubeli]
MPYNYLRVYPLLYIESDLFYLMKTRFSIIWIKVVALISVLLMSTHRADLSISEVETTLQFEIATDSSQVVINPDGPLNFLRGYIYQKMECMYNKRFFSPQIKTHYLLTKDEDMSVNYEVYKYNRNEQMDMAYPTDSKVDVFSKQYHTHLIELFPSPTGDINIETQGNQSFIQFLRAEKVEKHALQILAMLLLFSEGVDIPIDVSNKVLVVYEPNKKDEIYFEVPMEISWLNIKEERVETFKQKKVRQMISFFQKNATNQKILSLMMDKCTKEEVVSGKFLDSPKFLIQSYIFGFIDSAQRATEFIRTVHTMTKKYAPKTETPSKGDCVYDRLFKPSSTATGTDCMALMKKTQEILNTNPVFPFANSAQIPRYTSVPRYNRKTNTFSTDHLKNYSNCVECMILSLFCCLAYDPAGKIYRTDHMGNVSKELEEFFSPESQPFDTTKAELQKNWCKVVACLDEPSIAYCRKRNELDCGLINMLMVIAEVVNASREEKNKILGFSEILKEKKGELKNELLTGVKEYTKALLKRLSKIEDVEIMFSDIKSAKYKNGRYDISGKATIIFEHGEIKNAIDLDITKEHSSINLKPTAMNSEGARMEKMNEIAASCKNGASFVESLFATYVGYEVRKMDVSEDNNKEFIKRQIRKTIENNFTDINRLLLIKKINDIYFKKDLVTCSIIYTINQNLLPAHPIVRFTSNIVGSTELDNLYTQLQILPPIIFVDMLSKTGSSNLNYPNIKLEKACHDLVGYNLFACFFLNYIIDCDMNVFIRWIKSYIDNLYTQHGVCSNILLDSSMSRKICQHIFKDGTMKYSDIIHDFMVEKHHRKEDEIVSIVHFIWAAYLCLMESPNIELIRRNLNSIRETKLISWSCIYYFEAPSMFRKAIKMLNVLKDQLCEDENDTNKIGPIIEALTNI